MGLAYTETGNIQVTYSSPGGGIYASAGSYTSTSGGNPIDGTFKGSGTFSYTSPQIKITSIQTPTVVGSVHTFITTDTITIKATVSPANAGIPVKWTVTDALSSREIFLLSSPTVNTDSSGVSTLTFSPSADFGLVTYRRINFATASLTPNAAMELGVTAEATIQGLTFKTDLFQEAGDSLAQDTTDILRQEYVDFLAIVPARSVVVPTLGRNYNRGNYPVQVSIDLPGHYSTVLSAYRGRTVTVNGQSVTIPASAGVDISSGFRCPRRNLAIGSIFPNSRHKRGQALDLTPAPVSVMINGHRVRLSLHGTLYPALAAAAGGIAEQGATPVSVGDTRENHIHVQW